jgi:hypothetical protein
MPEEVILCGKFSGFPRLCNENVTGSSDVLTRSPGEMIIKVNPRYRKMSEILPPLPKLAGRLR